MLTPFPVIVEIFLKNIREKEYFENNKHYEELDEDHQPYFFTPARHGDETIPVKAVNIINGLFQKPHLIIF